MFRTALKRNTQSPKFRPRGENSSRIESFSDGVFALAVTLLVLSSSVPQTFTELTLAFADLIPFALCIVLLIIIWYEHYTYFYRYGLQDKTTVVLNTMLLFVVLFYVFPLKFLFRVLFAYFSSLITGQSLGNLFVTILPIEQAASLMIIYGLGAAAIYLILAAMFWHAHRQRQRLVLNPMEMYLTRRSLILNLISVLPPLLSAGIAAAGVGSNTTTFIVAGNIYWLYPVLIPLTTNYLNKYKPQVAEASPEG